MATPFGVRGADIFAAALKNFKLLAILYLLYSNTPSAAVEYSVLFMLNLLGQVATKTDFPWESCGFGPVVEGASTGSSIDAALLCFVLCGASSARRRSAPSTSGDPHPMTDPEVESTSRLLEKVPVLMVPMRVLVSSN